MGADPYLGEISMFAGNFAPRGWALCNGQLLPISQNSALFSLLGTIYGGDGRTTFALPDLRGRAPIHTGNGPGLPNFREGQRHGVYETTLSSANLPGHSHALLGSNNQPYNPATEHSGHMVATSGDADINTPAGNCMATYISAVKIYANEAPDKPMQDGTVKVKVDLAGSTSNAGGSQSFGNYQPSLAINFIIALQGTFPSRS